MKRERIRERERLCVEEKSQKEGITPQVSLSCRYAWGQVGGSLTTFFCIVIV